MRVRVDHGADAICVNLTDRPIKDSAEVARRHLSSTKMPRAALSA